MTGTVYERVGKYARGAVLYAFESMGGPRALAEWAEDNPDEFYTKLFPKIITKEVEVQTDRSVDNLVHLLDGDFEEVPVPADDVEGSGVAGEHSFEPETRRENPPAREAPAPVFVFDDDDEDEDET
jgi:hypothetical protein